MAYSDYGGYAYRNGELVIDRSDAVLSPDGIKSTPGMWPGWTMMEGRTSSHHVLLGDGPIFVSLYKQSRLRVFRLGEKIAEPDLYEGERKASLEIDGHQIEAAVIETDNYYLLVKLTQPDGTVWKGFSGYGVGAGLEDAGYGFSTGDVETELVEMFP